MYCTQCLIHLQYEYFTGNVNYQRKKKYNTQNQLKWTGLIDKKKTIFMNHPMIFLYYQIIIIFSIVVKKYWKKYVHTLGDKDETKNVDGRQYFSRKKLGVGTIKIRTWHKWESTQSIETYSFIRILQSLNICVRSTN